MPLGRPRRPGTDAERAAARRQQVRENVRAFRQRNRERAQSENQNESSDSDALSRRSSQSGSSSPLKPLASPTEALNSSFQGLSTSPQATSTIPVQTSLSIRNISLTSEYVGQTINWSLGLPFRIDLGPSYTDAFIAAFQYRNLPPTNPAGLSSPLEPGSITMPCPEPSAGNIDPSIISKHSSLPVTSELIRVEICYHSWTTSVTLDSACPGSEMLREALLSAALNLISIERNDRAMAMQAVRIQATALRKLRDGFDFYLEDKDPAKATLLSATALACSMSELLVNRSWDGFSLHLGGVGALIEHAGPQALNNRKSQDHFYGYRMVQFPFSILHRRSTFLHRDEWIHLDWRDGIAFEHPIHTLLDIVLTLPCEMEHYDKATTKRPGAIRRQLKKLNELALELNEWRIDLFAKYGSSMRTTATVNWPGLHNEALEFSNDIVATSFTMFAGARIALFSLVRQLAEDIKAEDESAIPVLNYSIEEAFKWSRIACQCVEYFFAKDPSVSGRVLCLFPLDTAWGTFVELSEKYNRDMTNELQWCQAAAERIEATGLPVFKRLENIGIDDPRRWYNDPIRSIYHTPSPIFCSDFDEFMDMSKGGMVESMSAIDDWMITDPAL